MVTNEIKRLKVKLNFLEQEGSSAVLMDLIDLVKVSNLRLQNESEKLGIIEDLKYNYKEALNSLYPQKSKQQKLFE
jgi:hypothetical protein